MEVKWLDYVKDDFKDFIKNAHEGTEETALKYVKKVVRETESILSSNVGKKSGKLFYYKGNDEIRILVIENYQIIYVLKPNKEIYIIGAIYKKLDFNEYIKKLFRNYNDIIDENNDV